MPTENSHFSQRDSETRWFDAIRGELRKSRDTVLELNKRGSVCVAAARGKRTGAGGLRSGLGVALVCSAKAAGDRPGEPSRAEVLAQQRAAGGPGPVSQGSALPHRGRPRLGGELGPSPADAAARLLPEQPRALAGVRGWGWGLGNADSSPGSILARGRPGPPLFPPLPVVLVVLGQPRAPVREK